MSSSNNALDYSDKELNKMSHLETFVTPDKTIVTYKPGLLGLGGKEYIVGKLEKIKDKKNGSKSQYTLVYKSKSLDSSVFVYNNLHIIDVMKMNRKKNLLKLNTQGKDNALKVLLLESDIDKQEDKSLTIAKGKNLDVKIIPALDNDEICYGY